MKITYRQVRDDGLRREITEAQYKGVIMKLEEFNDLVFIYGMESSNEGKGECQEMIDLLKEDFKEKKLCSSPPVSSASKHILDKKGVNYKEFMNDPKV
jgi:hypothetical protein